MLIPMVIANRVKAWWYATVATIGSVIGGAFGYAIGFVLLRDDRPADPEVLRQGRGLREFHVLVQRVGRVDHHPQRLDALSLQGANASRPV